MAYSDAVALTDAVGDTGAEPVIDAREDAEVDTVAEGERVALEVVNTIMLPLGESLTEPARLSERSAVGEHVTVCEGHGRGGWISH